MAQEQLTLVRGSDEHIQGVLDIIDVLPMYFVADVKNEVASLLKSNPSLVAVSSTGQVAGFLIWENRAQETELLWMAVLPSFRGRFLGSRLVHNCLKTLDPAIPIFLRTATTDSVIPQTQFDARLYADTHRFFELHGFTATEVLKGYWGPMNHCLVMRYQGKHSGRTNRKSGVTQRQ